MSLYSLIKPLLFKLDAEDAHNITLTAANYLSFLLPTKHYDLPKKVMGLHFPNPIGLAAGLDKNGAYIQALSKFGFGFIEIGTVTPKPQLGQTKPRLFRLTTHSALINRMGFNNVGAETLIKNVNQQKYAGILGINIGKNALTPFENAIEDYQLLLSMMYCHADYITINISSPNTEGLRKLQSEDYLKKLLEQLKNQQTQLSTQHQRYTPLALKLSPDLLEDEIESVSKQLLAFEIDGVIAVNTTISREGVENNGYAKEAGGLSGAPLCQKSTQVIRQLYAALGEKIPIIAAGGIMTPQNALEKFSAGAKLLQLYTGLIYHGPELVGDIYNALKYKDIKQFRAGHAQSVPPHKPNHN